MKDSRIPKIVSLNRQRCAPEDVPQGKGMVLRMTAYWAAFFLAETGLGP